MPEEKCRAIDYILDIIPSEEKTFMLYVLLKEFADEQREEAKKRDNENEAAYIRKYAENAEDIRTILAYQLW